ncbi:hypothetical protein CPB83DRAFT_852465 [Crepidotus variabilis]|uniref:Uncharacterized protein n=1 Tax=Crepidotus variabilis TaxID=179855 RepID=A0A9P6JQW0_9AGAR|nr:hypothetical protein CPB83DRAFT_852465 [Crepidotus variabilis]
MKFSLIFVAALNIIGGVSALPNTMGNELQIRQKVYPCEGPERLECPKGYYCCGPFLTDVGGRCFKGDSGMCPL